MSKNELKVFPFTLHVKCMNYFVKIWAQRRKVQEGEFPLVLLSYFIGSKWLAEVLTCFPHLRLKPSLYADFWVPKRIHWASLSHRSFVLLHQWPSRPAWHVWLRCLSEMYEKERSNEARKGRLFKSRDHAIQLLKSFPKGFCASSDAATLFNAFSMLSAVTFF